MPFCTPKNTGGLSILSTFALTIGLSYSFIKDLGWALPLFVGSVVGFSCSICTVLGTQKIHKAIAKKYYDIEYNAALDDIVHKQPSVPMAEIIVTPYVLNAFHEQPKMAIPVRDSANLAVKLSSS